jgi:N-acetylglucosamine malate deacetylase 1
MVYCAYDSLLFLVLSAFLRETIWRETDNMDLDVLCMVAHRDDADIIAGGTILKLKDQGYKVGIVDFSQGEMGSRGNAEERAAEAACAAEILGVDARINLGLPDAFIENTVENRRPVVKAIRTYRPFLVITHDLNNRNPDHTNTGLLVKQACFTAGLSKYDTGQPPHRPHKIIHGMEYFETSPTFVIDITDQYERKMKAIACYHSQTYNPGYEGPPTYISSERFFDDITARMRYYGGRIHSIYGEAFRLESYFEVRDLVQEVALRALIPGQGRKP